MGDLVLGHALLQLRHDIAENLIGQVRRPLHGGKLLVGLDHPQRHHDRAGVDQLNLRQQLADRHRPLCPDPLINRDLDLAPGHAKARQRLLERVNRVDRLHDQPHTGNPRFALRLIDPVVATHARRHDLDRTFSPDVAAGEPIPVGVVVGAVLELTANARQVVEIRGPGQEHQGDSLLRHRRLYRANPSGVVHLLFLHERCRPRQHPFSVPEGLRRFSPGFQPGVPACDAPCAANPKSRAGLVTIIVRMSSTEIPRSSMQAANSRIPSTGDGRV